MSIGEVIAVCVFAVVICIYGEAISQKSGNGSLFPDRGEKGNPVGFFIVWVILGFLVALVLGIL